MKRIFFYIFTFQFFLLSTYSYIQKWDLIDRFPGDEWASEFSNFRIARFDSLNCVVSSNQGYLEGHIRISSDGGKTWRTALKLIDTVKKYQWVYGKYELHIRGISYPHPSLCVAGGDSCYIYISRDSCNSWQRIKLGDGWKSTRTGVTMYDTSFGVFVSYYDMFVTRDGWRTWKRINKNFSETFGESTGFGRPALPEQGVIFTTFSIMNNSTGLRDTAAFARSLDYGVTWEITPNTYPVLSVGFMFDKSRGFAAGGEQIEPYSPYYYNQIKYTSDGGKTWEVRLDTLIPYTEPINRLKFWDEKYGTAISNRNIWKTSDFGKTWTVDTSFHSKALPGKLNLFDFEYLTLDRIIFVGWIGNEVFMQTSEFETSVAKDNILSSSDVLLYPNPVGNILYFGTQLEKAEIFTLEGVKALEAVNVSKINVGGLAQGMYFIRLNNCKMKKFVKLD